MDLDWKATCRRRGKAQRRDNVRHDVAFDVVAMQMDLHGFVRAHANYDLIVLANRQNARFGGWLSTMNLELENPVFGMSAGDRDSDQHRDQQRASAILESRSKAREEASR